MNKNRDAKGQFASKAGGGGFNAGRPSNPSNKGKQLETFKKTSKEAYRAKKASKALGNMPSPGTDKAKFYAVKKAAKNAIKANAKARFTLRGTIKRGG